MQIDTKTGAILGSIRESQLMVRARPARGDLLRQPDRHVFSVVSKLQGACASRRRACLRWHMGNIRLCDTGERAGITRLWTMWKRKSMQIVMRCTLALFTVLTVLVGYAEGAAARQTEFYLASNGNDDNPGTKESPWRTVAKIHNYALSPGDTIYFARGSLFTGGFTVSSSGSREKPITFTAYGEGALPTFTNSRYEHLNGNAIQITGSYIVVEKLSFYNCPQSPVVEDIRTIGAVFIALGADHNIVRDCEMTKTPIGIQVYGQHTLITRNYIHDNNVAIRPYWGPVCVFVNTSNNEVSYNRFVNYSAPSNEYGHDGGAIEINDRNYPKENVHIHHNYSYRNQGFIEFVGRTKQDNFLIHHNVSEDYQSFVGFTGPCTNMRIENNTVIRVLAHELPDSEDVTFWFYNDNSGLTFRNNIFVYDPSRIEPCFREDSSLMRTICITGSTTKVFNARHFLSIVGQEFSAYTRLVVGGGASLGEGDRIDDRCSWISRSVI